MKRFLLSLLLTALIIVPGAVVHAQPAPQQRIHQPVVINGQEVQGITVVQNGTVQTYTCPDPQPYTAADQSSSGYACFDQTSGTWLLNAEPPQNAGTVYNSPPAYYPEEPAYTYSPYVYPYDYPYGYYPYYGYGGPFFSFGFGGGHGFFGHGHEHFGEHGFEGHRGFEGHGGEHGGFGGHGGLGGGHGGGFGHGGGGHGGGGHGGGHR